jgi:hypothetical protein
MEQVQEVASTALQGTPWAPDWNFNLIKMLIMTVIFIVVVVLFQVYGNVAEISQNFAKYRCNPAIMPFAGLFGQNATENFSFCMKQILSGQAASVFGPIYTILGNFVAIMTTMSGSLMSLRTMFSNFYGGVNNFIGNFQRRIQSLLLQIRLSFIKMQNLMGRVYGTMMATMFMGMSAITAGTSLGDNSLVKFIFATAPCFAPETPVWMADGTWRPIHRVVLGDSVRGMDGFAHPVTAVFRFDGRQTPMVTLDSNTVSTTHYVRHGGAWIPAVNHPSALPTRSIPEIWCLNVAGHHAFFIGGATAPLCVADYRESSDPRVLAAAAAVAEKGLNGLQRSSSAPAEYTFGVVVGTMVALADGTFRPVEKIKEGDVLEGSGRVYGVVQEHSPTVAGDFGPAQYVWSAADRQWRRASELFEAHRKPATLYSVFTTGCSAIRVKTANGVEYFIRDYAEVPLPEMEAPFELALSAAEGKESALANGHNRQPPTSNA